MTAHQRLIRDNFAVSEPRPAASSLAGYSVVQVSRAQALPVILRYEWLGTIGKATSFAGLLSPGGELHGVACFGHGPGGAVERVIGAPALCLERGACVHYAPTNAASFLINNGCKLIRSLTGVERFFAYADPSAGEYGGVYQAAGWLYLGQGLDGRKGRARRTRVLRPGADPTQPANWSSTQALRRQGARLSYRLGRDGAASEAESLGWTIDRALKSGGGVPGKHVYATHAGVRKDERSKWRLGLVSHPYPKPAR